MALTIYEFFGIIGVNAYPPTNMAELIPYLLTVVVGAWLVSVVFGVIGKIIEFLFSFRIR